MVLYLAYTHRLLQNPCRKLAISKWLATTIPSTFIAAHGILVLK